MITPVRVGIIAMIANMVFNLALVIPLFFFFNLGHVGLALATSISSFLNAGLLLYYSLKKGFYIPLPGWARFFLRISREILDVFFHPFSPILLDTVFDFLRFIFDFITYY